MNPKIFFVKKSGKPEDLPDEFGCKIL